MRKKSAKGKADLPERKEAKGTKELNKAMEKWVSEIAKKHSVSDILKKILREKN